jgi:hypothetical protein
MRKKTGIGMWVVALGLLVGLAAPACSTLSWKPGQVLTSNLRVRTAEFVDDFTVAIGLIDEAAAVADTLPLPTAVKDGIDCAIKQALGDDAPSVLVVRVCGSVPTRTDAKVRVAIRTLRQLMTDVSIKSAVRAALDVIVPIVDRMVQSGNTRLSLLANILRYTLRGVTAAGGV